MQNQPVIANARPFREYLSTRQERGLRAIGEAFIPGFTNQWTWTTNGQIITGLHAGDRRGVLALFHIFGCLPAGAAKILPWITRIETKLPPWLSSFRPFIRLLHLGLRGVVYSLHYSDQKVRESMNYHTSSGNDIAAAKTEPEIRIKVARNAASRLRSEDQKSDMQVRVKWIGNLRKVILSEEKMITARIVQETGKSATDAFVSEIFAVLDHLEYLEKHSWATLQPQRVPTPIALLGKKSEVIFEPLGVALVISPWNYPFAMAIMPITTALAAGNAVIYKPSEHTPLTGLLEDLFRKAGIPDEVIQIAYGDGEVARRLIDAKPNKVFFTGSVSTGKKIMAQAANHLIPVELELGGKDPMIVFEDANIARASAGALWGAMTNTGQACTSIERLYVQQDIYAKFIEALVHRANKLRFDPNHEQDMGRMTTKFQVNKVREHLEDALAKGATLLTGDSWDRHSQIIPPLVLANVTNKMLIANEETFGPILPVMSFVTESEVIQLANESQYGLAASVWSGDQSRARRVARALVTGNVSINNVMLTEGNSALPFGGVKNSGFGRYRGRFGLESFSNVKALLTDKNSKKIEANWYPYTAKKLELFRLMTMHMHKSGLLAFLKFVVTALKLEAHAQKSDKEQMR